MFYDIFAKLCADRGVTPAQVVRELNLNKSTVSMWKVDKTTPKASTINSLASYFNVSMDYLLGREE